MKFGEMIDILQKKEVEYIVLINSGRFFIARGKDAILLNKELDLKLVCMEKEICKVGFHNISLEKYMKILKRKRYAFIVYNFDRELNNLEIITKYDGRIKSLGKEVRRDCIMCRMGNTEYKEKEALIRIRKFLKENLELELNNKTQIFKSAQRVNYCRYKINEYRLKIRDKVKIKNIETLEND